MSDQILLAEIDAVALEGGTVTTLFVATHPYRTPAAVHPPAGRYYRPLIQSRPEIGQYLFARDAVTGSSRLEVADLPVVNRGFIDPLAYAFDGQRIRLLSGPSTAPYDAFTVLFDGRQDPPDWTRAIIRFKAADGGLVFDRPIGDVEYGGTGGLDGPAEMAGRRAPVACGYCARVEGQYVGVVDGVHTYRLADRSLHAIVRGYTRGKADMAAVTAKPVAAGEYRLIPDGYVQVGGDPREAVLTWDILAAPADACHTAAVYAALAGRVLDPGTIAGERLDALAAADAGLHGEPAVIGHWWDGDRRLRDALDDVARDIWAPWIIGRDGRFGALLFDPAPDAEPAARMSAAAGQVRRDGLRAVTGGGGQRSLPPSRVRVGYGRCHRVHGETEIASAAAEADAAFVRTDYRWAAADDVVTAAAHAGAQPMDVPTGLRDAAPAALLAARMLTGEQRAWRYQALAAPAVEPGQTLWLEAPVFGWRGGAAARVISAEIDGSDVTYGLWR